MNTTRSQIISIPEYFDRYILLVEDIPLLEALERGLQNIVNIDLIKLERVAKTTYSKEKWTVNEIFQHLMDIERIFSYRAMLIARKDQTITAGFDQKYLSDNSKANQRTFPAIQEEMIALRTSTISLFRSFDEEMMFQTGLNWKYQMSVLAIGFCIIGHQIWHERILHDKYF